MTPALSALEVSRLAGVTLRQLQWWDETSVISPDRNSHSRSYSEDQAFLVAVVAELRRRGFSLQKVRRVVEFLTANQRRLTDLLQRNSEVYLVTNGHRQNNLTLRRELPEIVVSRIGLVTTLNLSVFHENIFVRLRLKRGNAKRFKSAA